jgi:hypothetical protein
MCVPNDVSGHIRTAEMLMEMASVNQVQGYERKGLQHIL